MKTMETYLVFVDAVNNSNKFWGAKVEGSSLTVEWGRVGYNSQKKVRKDSGGRVLTKGILE